MKDLPAIEAIYTKFANILDKELDQIRQVDPSGVFRIEEQQRIHDSAYFILAWGQFEAHLNDECVKAITRRKSNPNCEVRRAWDAHNEQSLRLRFEDRAALLLDRRNTASDAYRRTIKLYNQRNAVAHGTSLATGIDVPAVIADLYQIVSEMSS